MMNNEMLVKMLDSCQKFIEMAAKTNQISIDSIEALIKLQMESSVARFKSYMDLTEAAIGFHDMESYKAFLDKYGQTIINLQRQIGQDAQALAEMMDRFKADFEKLAHKNS